MRTSPVLITGCSSGIGHATARRLSTGPRPVYATARQVADLADLVDIGCHTLALDVTDPESIAAAVAQVEEDHGHVGVLVNNAGYSQSGAVVSVSNQDARRQFDTNVFGPIDLIREVLPGMRQARSGRIVNVSSIGGRLTFPGGGWYHASKHALESLSDALRHEVRGYGIHVVVVEPGIIRTGFADAATSSIPDSDADDPWAEFNKTVKQATTAVYEEGPLAKLGGQPDDVAKVIQQAIEVGSPRARYRVTPSATMMLALRDVLPDRAWDAVMRTNFPSPGAD